MKGKTKSQVKRANEKNQNNVTTKETKMVIEHQAINLKIKQNRTLSKQMSMKDQCK